MSTAETTRQNNSIRVGFTSLSRHHGSVAFAGRVAVVSAVAGFGVAVKQEAGPL